MKHHLDDLRTLFIFASKNRNFANPTDDVTRLERKNGRSKWRPYTLGRTDQDLDGSSQRGAGHPLVPMGRRATGAQGQRDC